MPIYHAECRVCKHVTEYVASMAACHLTPACENCSSPLTSKIIVSAPAVFGDLNDFSTENGGKGRWNHQLKQHVTSVADATAKAAKRGWEVLDKA